MLLAKRAKEVGLAFVDYKTPLHFAVGFAAGAIGMSPHVAAIIFVGIKALKAGAEYGLGEGLFGEADAQSHANEMGDLFFEMIGISAGLKAREVITGRPAHAVHGLGGKIVGVGVPKRSTAELRTGMVSLPVNNPPM